MSQTVSLLLARWNHRDVYTENAQLCKQVSNRFCSFRAFRSPVSIQNAEILKRVVSNDRAQLLNNRRSVPATESRQTSQWKGTYKKTNHVGKCWLLLCLCVSDLQRRGTICKTIAHRPPALHCLRSYGRAVGTEEISIITCNWPSTGQLHFAVDRIKNANKSHALFAPLNVLQFLYSMDRRSSTMLEKKSGTVFVLSFSFKLTRSYILKSLNHGTSQIVCLL